MSADCAETHGREFSSTHETIVVRICFVVLLSTHVLSAVVVSCCVLRLCDVELAWA